MSVFNVAMKFIAKWEWGNREDGAYTNDPSDPGGETKFGCSKRANPDLDIKNLTKEKAYSRFRERYFQPYERLEPRLACVLFDTAINLGEDDSDAFLKQTNDPRGILELRRAKYIRIARKRPASQKYLKGWLNRVNDLSKFIDIEWPLGQSAKTEEL